MSDKTRYSHGSKNNVYDGVFKYIVPPNDCILELDRKIRQAAKFYRWQLSIVKGAFLSGSFSYIQKSSWWSWFINHKNQRFQCSHWQQENTKSSAKLVIKQNFFLDIIYILCYTKNINTILRFLISEAWYLLIDNFRELEKMLVI